MNEEIQVLLVMSEEEQTEFLETIDNQEFGFHGAANYGQARAALADPHLDIIVTNVTLDDGSWWNIYQDLANDCFPAELVVVTPRKNVDVSQLLAHGVAAVLGRPLGGYEVRRALQTAASAKRGQFSLAAAAAGQRG